MRACKHRSALLAFLKHFSKLRAYLKCHNIVYIISSKNTYLSIGYWPSLFGQEGWILAKFVFCVFMDRDEVEVHKLAKKGRGQYPVILTEQTWSIKDLLYGFWWNLARGIHWVVPSGQDGSILPARVANHSARFGSSCPLAKLAIQ